MYSTLLSKIQTTLEACDKLQVIYNYPEMKIEGYPAALYYATNFDNGYLTAAENLRAYDFQIYIAQEAEKASMTQAVNTILAPAVDQVLDQFDEDWSQGAIDGHRVWWELTNGGQFFTEQNSGGIVVSFELNLKINVVVNI